jgi:predicted AAA+ superfamily ATPase
MKKYLPRVVDSEIDDYLSVFGAILVQGPKWCGKSRTSFEHSNSKYLIADPNGNFQNKLLAEEDPTLILQGENPRVIDEWQDVPSIWDAIKFDVDQQYEKGLYILTGSSVPPNFSTFHSGNNRIGKINMYPMSLYESGESTGQIPFKDLFTDKKIGAQNHLTLKQIIALCVRGGWPENIEIDENKQRILPKSYIKYFVEDDISKYDGKKRSNIIALNILKSISRNTHTLVTKKTLINDVNISEPTFDDYFEVFNNLFVVDCIPAWSPNIRSKLRLRTSPKVRLVDPSLAIACLGLSADQLLNDLNTFGFMFENLCARDIKIYAENIGAKVFHYRENLNSNGTENEIDLIVELENGDWGGFEIKLGANQIESAEKNLLKISKKLVEKGANEPKCLCIISGLSNYGYTMPSGVKVVPIGCLGI